VTRLARNKKARKRRVPGGHRTPVASGGDWLKKPREKILERTVTVRGISFLTAMFLWSGCRRIDLKQSIGGRDDKAFAKTRQHGISPFHIFFAAEWFCTDPARCFGKNRRFEAALTVRKRSGRRRSSKGRESRRFVGAATAWERAIW
jgi:hypothetical protein